MKKRLFRSLPVIFFLPVPYLFSQSQEPVAFDVLKSPPASEEIQEAYSSFPETLSCMEFKTGDVVFDTHDVEARGISYKSEGLTVYGILAKPKKNGKYPLILYNHGGFTGLGSIDNKAIFSMVDMGYVVLASAYRGEQGPGGKSQGEVEFGGGEVVDVMNLLECGKTLPYVNTQKIIMMGGSHGGMITLLAASHSKDLAAAVDFVGPANLFLPHYLNMFKEALDAYLQGKKFSLLGAEISQTLRDAFASAVSEKKGTSFLRKELIRRSALYFAEHISCPLLLVYGANDFLVPVEEAYSLETELKKHNKNFKLKVFETQSHGFFGHSEREVETLTFGFLEETLK